MDDTTDTCVDLRDHAAVGRPQSWFYGVFTVALTLLLALSFLGVYGVRDTTVRASGGGYDLEVRYAEASRPALATPFAITVTKPGGFDGPVTVAITAEYLAMWDENGLSPAPSSETTDGDWLVWEFDPPVGDTLSIGYDARIEPAAQNGERGQVQVREDDEPVVTVSFETEVLP